MNTEECQNSLVEHEGRADGTPSFPAGRQNMSRPRPETMPAFRVERSRPRDHPSRTMPTLAVGRGAPGAARRGHEDVAAPRAGLA